jgi:hypothetical protein
MTSEKIYKQKYLKYKAKYLKLKQMIGGIPPKKKLRRESGDEVAAAKAKIDDEATAAKYIADLEGDLEGDDKVVASLQPPANTYNRHLVRLQYIKNINEIYYTQNTVSNIFEDRINSVVSNLQKITRHIPRKSFSISEIAEILKIPLLSLNLDCIVDIENKFYSCNNRRLCMLKSLYSKGLFDGNVTVVVKSSCSHSNECLDDCKDVHVNMGYERGIKCSDL